MRESPFGRRTVVRVASVLARSTTRLIETHSPKRVAALDVDRLPAYGIADVAFVER